MIAAIRWGRSDYETDTDLKREVESLSELGVGLECVRGPAPDLSAAEVLIVTSGVRVTRAVIEHAKTLRMIVTTTSGWDHVDVNAARAQNIHVVRCPLARRDAVVDTSLAMGLALRRQLPSLQKKAIEGVWDRASLPRRATGLVRGLRVGLVGQGVIGKAARKAWEAVGAEVRFTDPHVEKGIELNALLGWAEILSLHCNLNASTAGLVNESSLSRMAAGSIVINTARGACVDLHALDRAEHLGGIGLDVYPEEPCSHLAELSKRDNVILTPHSAGYHPGLGEAVRREVVAAVRAYLEDEVPENLVV